MDVLSIRKDNSVIFIIRKFSLEKQHIMPYNAIQIFNTYIPQLVNVVHWGRHLFICERTNIYVPSSAEHP